MNRNRKLSIAERLVIAMGNLYTKMNFGYINEAFNETLVRGVGIKGYFGWADAAGKALAALTAKYGSAHAQYVIGWSAMLNGCAWCGVGHIRAGNIILFKEKGVLFPIDDAEILELQRKTDREIAAVAHERLSTSYPDILALLERVHVLKRGEPAGADDTAIVLGIAAWDWVNECSILMDHNQVLPAQAPINKDKATVTAYDTARANGRGA